MELPTVAAVAARTDPIGNRLLRVDHAGEHGAVNIYRGQRWLAWLTARTLLPQLRAFQSHEEGHRARFRAALSERRYRRCPLYWMCGLGGLVLGLLTGLCGRRAIAATTVAVERVVLRHLRDQMEVLSNRDPAAAAVIRSIVEEEQQHHDVAAEHLEGRRGFWVRLLEQVVSASTETVIWLGMRLF